MSESRKTTRRAFLGAAGANQTTVGTANPKPAPLGKFAHYSYWTPCTVTPTTNPGMQYEFYDYANLGNTSELGNNVNYQTAPTSGLGYDLFTCIDPNNSSSLFFTELRRPLQYPAYQCAQQTALSNYFAYLISIGYNSGCTPNACTQSPPTCPN